MLHAQRINADEIEYQEYRRKLRYTMTYQQSDWGTTRILIVKDQSGRIIGQCDPYPNGIPVDPKRRAKMLKQAAQRLISGA